MGLWCMLLMLAGDPAWSTTAPAGLPPVTVRWADAAQEATVVVEGADYQCVVDTLPLRIRSLSLGGKSLLGAGGVTPTVVDAAGRLLRPASIRPEWDVWRGQRWQPASSGRARMNVWSASPYYWDCHLLDIPMMADDEVAKYAAAAGPPVAAFDFTKDHRGCTAAHSTELSRAPDAALRIGLTGDDPYIGLPPLDVPGPVRASLRLRTGSGGGAAIYYGVDGQPIDGKHLTTFAVSGDGAWHDVEVELGAAGQRITSWRFDPPGETGTVDLASIVLRRGPDGTRPKPARGELILHAQPSRLAIEFRLDPEPGRPAAKSLRLDLGADLTGITADAGRPLGLLGGLALLAQPGTALGRTVEAPLAGARPGAYLVLRPTAGQSAAAALADDLRPLADASVEVTDGHWLGYDPIAGLYRAEVDREPAAFGFDPAFHNPTRRMDLGLSLRNDAQPRQMVVKVQSGAGNLEAGALTDRFGFILPTAAFVAKNFAGEKEEPDDSAFGDIYFPVGLAAGEAKSCQVQPLTANWGIWPLKQVSSIRFFLIYWHCSTGPSETTCWAMDTMRTKGAVFEIPDFRPMSGPFWAGQPQHDCQHWPGWLQYNDAKGTLCYERTTFDSIAPSLARFTMDYHTSDDTARAKVTAWEAPQRDEMRTMLRLRYDWVAPCTIEGDARRGFRWFNMSHFRGRNALLLWTGADGKTEQRAVPAKEDFVLLGQPMAAQAPFMSSEGPGEKYGVVTLVQRFAARLGGQTYDRPAMSAAFDAKDASTWLTVPAETLRLQPGDWLEADIMLMPVGEPSPPGFRAERERERFGLKPAKITTRVGAKVSDYPPQVRAEADVAAFRLEGGHGDLPLIVDGLSGWKLPLLWTNGIWQDHQVHGGDGYQVQADGQGGYRVTFIAPHRDGQSADYLVTRASCTGDIAQARDRNGRLELVAAQPGRWTLKAPAPFAPGTNHWRPGVPAMTFEGDGPSVRQVPLGITAAQPVDVTVESWTPRRMVLATSAAAELTLGGLRSGGDYAVTTAGQTTTRRADGGSLRVTLAAAGRVEVVAP